MIKTKGFVISLLCLLILFLAPQIASRFYIYLLALIFVNGLLATSLNLVLGFGGMYQFHHAVFYGIGAYSLTLILTKTNLPAWTAFSGALAAAAVASLLTGLICIRLSKLYFGMLQLSLGSLVWAVAYRWYSFTGGDDGIHGIPVPEFLSSTTRAYYFSLI